MARLGNRQCQPSETPEHDFSSKIARNREPISLFTLAMCMRNLGYTNSDYDPPPERCDFIRYNYRQQIVNRSDATRELKILIASYWVTSNSSRYLHFHAPDRFYAVMRLT